MPQEPADYVRFFEQTNRIIGLALRPEGMNPSQGFDAAVVVRMYKKLLDSANPRRNAADRPDVRMTLLDDEQFAIAIHDSRAAHPIRGFFNSRSQILASTSSASALERRRLARIGLRVVAASCLTPARPPRRCSITARKAGTARKQAEPGLDSSISSPCSITSTFMSINASRAESAQRHTYRLALYGRKNSGKSCILAALGLGLERIPHPDGLACVWINDDTTIPVPQGGASWTIDDPIPVAWDLDDPAITRHLGRQWMKKAVKELKDGEVPRPTPIDVAPFRFLFDFNDPKTGREFRVEMIDYSGELVRAEGSEDLFARRLRAQLETMDGILVLAEAPRSSEESQPLYRELNLLIEAFRLLADQRRGKRVPPFPVALVFNKWDRQSRMEHYSRAESEVELDVYLRRTPPPPQRGLLNVLQTVSGSNPERPNCLSFALSAFGRAVSVERTNEMGERVMIEVPANATPLRSYGLEDPFVWLCKRSDEIEADRIVQRVAGLRFWNVSQTFHLVPLSYIAQTRQFMDRFPRGPRNGTPPRGSCSVPAPPWQSRSVFCRPRRFSCSA